MTALSSNLADQLSKTVTLRRTRFIEEDQVTNKFTCDYNCFADLDCHIIRQTSQQISTCLHKQPLLTDKESRMHLLCLTLLFLIKWSAGLQCAINAQWRDKLGNSVSVQARGTPDLDIVNIANDATITITCESFGPVQFQIHVKNSDSNPARTYYNGNKLAMSRAHFVPGRYHCECTMNGQTAVSAELFLAGTYAYRHIPLQNTLSSRAAMTHTHTHLRQCAHIRTYVRTHVTRPHSHSTLAATCMGCHGCTLRYVFTADYSLHLGYAVLITARLAYLDITCYCKSNKGTRNFTSSSPTGCGCVHYIT